MKTMITLFMMACTLSFAQAQNALEVYKTDIVPTVDGKIDDKDPWGNNWVNMELSADASTTEAMSAQFQLLHDGGNSLYLAIKVNDDTPNFDPVAFEKPFKRDNCEVFFSMKNANTATGEFESGDWQIRCLRGVVDDGAFINGNGSVNNLLADEGFKFAVFDGGTDYVQEFIFPLSVLAEESLFDGENFRFDIQAADNSGADRTQQQFWNNNSDQQWHNTNIFGEVHLNPDEAPVTAIKSLKSAPFTAFVKNNTLQVSDVNGMVAIYDIAGKKMAEKVINDNGVIDISKCTTGLYIVKCGDYSVKVIR